MNADFNQNLIQEILDELTGEHNWRLPSQKIRRALWEVSDGAKGGLGAEFSQSDVNYIKEETMPYGLKAKLDHIGALEEAFINTKIFNEMGFSVGPQIENYRNKLNKAYEDIGQMLLINRDTLLQSSQEPVQELKNLLKDAFETERRVAGGAKLFGILNDSVTPIVMAKVHGIRIRSIGHEDGRDPNEPEP